MQLFKRRDGFCVSCIKFFGFFYNGYGVAAFVFVVAENKSRRIRHGFFKFFRKSAERYVFLFFGCSVREFPVAGIQDYFVNIGGRFVNRIIFGFCKIGCFFQRACAYNIVAVACPTDKIHSLANRNFVESDFFAGSAVIVYFHTAVVKHF